MPTVFKVIVDNIATIAPFAFIALIVFGLVTTLYVLKLNRKVSEKERAELNEHAAHLLQLREYLSNKGLSDNNAAKKKESAGTDYLR